MSHSPKFEFQAFAEAKADTAVILVGEDLKPSAQAIAVLGKGLTALLQKAVKVEGFKGAYLSSISIVAPSEIGAGRLVVVGLGGKKDAEKLDWANVGGACAAAAKKGSALIIADSVSTEILPENVAEMAFGVRLRGYRFDQYKSKKKGDDANNDHLTKVVFAVADADATKKAFKHVDPVADGVILARTLVNEPANILNPAEFAKRASALEKLGLEVEVLEEKELAKLGMRSLLAVGQGSANSSKVVIMRWNGGKGKKEPIAFVGKGVCFDTGGISIKPAQGMEDMKGDMGGAACVTGLMCALAGRKAKVNAVGVIGLVENMPDGNAQRPGDIVTAMSGTTIEVINTDAEGRMVLADALWYTQERFKPKFMIDLATLTGAIMIALGNTLTGMFSNNDELAEQLQKAGTVTGEKVWRMPLGQEFDKMIESQFADIKNTGGRLAGASTAAAFLQRFVNDVPWVHLDIAGTAMNSPKNEISQTWASGWGVRLLDRVVRDNYEG
ncbi:leucyl aminopeptidase [Microvirga sp. W0021]|uniref:Probable cytosol aminopeptidase n=1 Tax=Hohaiivirga grylli TaxID=3133970 RepID=A0ABV0BJS9_9HYPH